MTTSAVAVVTAILLLMGPSGCEPVHAAQSPPQGQQPLATVDITPEGSALGASSETVTLASVPFRGADSRVLLTTPSIQASRTITGEALQLPLPMHVGDSAGVAVHKFCEQVEGGRHWQ
jgi:hypothetical protein